MTWKVSLKDRIPVLQWVPQYTVKRFIVHDIFAGLTLAAFAVPQVHTLVLGEVVIIVLAFILLFCRIIGVCILRLGQPASRVWTIHDSDTSPYLFLFWNIAIHGRRTKYTYCPYHWLYRRIHGRLV